MSLKGIGGSLNPTKQTGRGICSLKKVMMESNEEKSLDEEVQLVLASNSSVFELHSQKADENVKQESKISSGNEDNEEKPDEDSMMNESFGNDNRSAFLPYQLKTVLTNLQRGNMKTETAPSSPEMNLFQLVAQGEVFDCDIEDRMDNGDENGLTLLMWAAANGQINTTKMLINKNADVNMVGMKNNETALQLAACFGHNEIVKQLLLAGAEVDKVDTDGNTALIYATYNNHISCMNLLLNAGADITIENELWQSALEIAVRRKCCHAQTVLEKHILKIMEK
ncbi:Ankyrin repeat family A protein 2 [Nymphon striatum]|nr:Ankyrin repeat family A protein 2 [Nymphon striatum]